MIDIHCHILPGVDDGPKDWDMTLAMCRFAQADGITHIVATPHANYRYPYDRARHEELVEMLREKMPSMDFSLGCDFHLSQENIDDAVQHPERYVIGETAYLLVEFSDFQTPDQMKDSLFRLHSAGLITIVTHPERNPIIDQYPDLPQQFFDMGASLQITAGSLCGEWGRKSKRTSESLLKKNIVRIIATDAHEPEHRRPQLSLGRNAAARIVGQEVALILVQDNPCTVVSQRPQVEEVSTGLKSTL